MIRKRIITALSMITLAASVCYGASAMPVDVPQSHWAHSVVSEAAAGGWLIVDSQGSFRPDSPATREDVVRMMMPLWNRAYEHKRTPRLMVTEPAPGDGYADLQGLPEEERLLLLQAVSNNLLSGYEDGTLRPGRGITRGEFAVIVARNCVSTPGPGHEFSDSGTFPGWVKASIEAMAAQGIVTGYGDGSFRAGAPVSRAEALAMLMRWSGEMPTAPVPQTGFKAEMLRQINQERAREGKTGLVYDAAVEQIAQDKADDMAKNRYFDHVSPLTGETLGGRFQRFAYPTKGLFGENLLKSNAGTTAAQAVGLWMDSPPHRANMLNDYTRIGIGVQTGADGYRYMVLNFVRPN